MIAVLLVLLVLAVALVCYLAGEIVELSRELRTLRQADADDMNRLDAWATLKELEQIDGKL